MPTERARPDGRDVTEMVKQFYEQTPFPNYDDLDNPRALIEKAREGMFARLLNEQIPYDARVVEIGCGTGQLTNFLAIAHRSVLGVDVCLNSLRLAERFKAEHGLERATFAQMNLFRPALKDGFFDVVISNGVLHHTATAAAPSDGSAAWPSRGATWSSGCTTPISRQLHYARRGPCSGSPGSPAAVLDPHFAKMRGQRQARGLVPRPVLSSPRDLPHAGRGPGLDGRGRPGLRQLDPQAGGRPSAGCRRAAVRAEGSRATALGRIREPARRHGQRLSRRRVLHRHRQAAAGGGVMIGPNFPEEAPSRVLRSAPSGSSPGCAWRSSAVSSP